MKPGISHRLQDHQSGFRHGETDLSPLVRPSATPTQTLQESQGEGTGESHVGFRFLDLWKGVNADGDPGRNLTCHDGTEPTGPRLEGELGPAETDGSELEGNVPTRPGPREGSEETSSCGVAPPRPVPVGVVTVGRAPLATDTFPRGCRGTVVVP